MIVFEPLHDDVEAPVRATAGSAGYDLKAYIRGMTLTMYDANNQKATLYDFRDVVAIPPRSRVLVPLGFKATIPQGWECQIRPRSGLAFKQGLRPVNTPGTIDEDYPEEWGVLLENITDEYIHLTHGDKIAQAVLAPYGTSEWVRGTVGQTTDRTSGFGSTGQ